ncbi:unnamed protein product [Paramecium sonneborni]|uniref:Uncharacterized protein n=1 Tax=Paramecium sonneborni TaxID=65129 RepID=A0A8S1RSG2_9CILI|nr:unnamed protein product [Paramecium sonneborni]
MLFSYYYYQVYLVQYHYQLKAKTQNRKINIKRAVQRASQSNGAIISSARINLIALPDGENSPLRNSLYFVDKEKNQTGAFLY